MNQKVRIKTAKGLFVELRARGLVSVQTIAGLEKSVVPLMKPGERAACLKALASISKLPKLVDLMYVSKFDDAFDRSAQSKYEKRGGNNNEGLDVHESRWQSTEGPGWAVRPSAVVECYGWFAPQPPKGASSGEGLACPTPKEAGWLDVGEAVESIEWIGAMLGKIGLPPVHKSRTKGAKNAEKNAIELIFSPVDDFAELAGATAWMLFEGSGRSGGFIDDKGGHGPIGRARMFESPKAAARAAEACRLEGWKVVRSAVEIRGLEDFAGDTVSDKLAHAMALQERATLRKALETASVEDLKCRLRELEELAPRNSAFQECPRVKAGPARQRL